MILKGLLLSGCLAYQARNCLHQDMWEAHFHLVDQKTRSDHCPPDLPSAAIYTFTYIDVQILPEASRWHQVNTVL